MKTKLIAVFCLIFPPSRIKNSILRVFGWNVDKSANIGFSYLCIKKTSIEKNASIGHLNFIDIPILQMDSNAYIQNLNRISGPLYLSLGLSAAIGNMNTIKRASHPISWGKSIVKIGTGSKITSRHIIDCTRPVRIGEYSILAGMGSQVWTHGYIHAPVGPDRYRIDGSVNIGNNVYIGSSSVINPGVCISDKVTVGSHATVSKSLTKPGLYVNQTLRHIPFDYEKSREKYDKVKLKNPIEKIFQKKC